MEKFDYLSFSNQLWHDHAFSTDVGPLFLPSVFRRGCLGATQKEVWACQSAATAFRPGCPASTI